MRLFVSLRHRNFRLLWIGLVVANMGTLLQFVAQDYLVYTITGKAFWLGVVDAAGALTLIAVSFAGGALADRLPKRKTLLVTQTLFALMPAAIGFDVWFGTVNVWHVVLFSIASMAVLAVDHPTRQALLPRLVPREDLVNAIGLNAVTFTGAAAIGPALAGPVIAWKGIPAAFFLDAVSSAAVIAAIVMLRLPTEATKAHVDLGQSLREGAAYLRKVPVLLVLASLLAVVSFCAYPYQTLLPAFTDRVLHRGVMELGFLRAAPGVGAILGAIIVAALRDRQRTPRRIFEGAIGFAIVLGAFAMMRSLAFALLLLVAAGTLFTIFQSTTQAFLQLRASDEMRGRVMSLFALSVIGVGPLGSFPLGWLADRIGVPWAILLGAIVAGLYSAAVWVLARRMMRGLQRDAQGTKAIKSKRASQPT